MLTNYCMYLQWYLELLSLYCGFDSRREHFYRRYWYREKGNGYVKGTICNQSQLW